MTVNRIEGTIPINVFPFEKFSEANYEIDSSGHMTLELNIPDELARTLLENKVKTLILDYEHKGED